MSTKPKKKNIPEKRIEEFKSHTEGRDKIVEALKSGELNNAICDDFIFYIYNAENIQLTHFIWRGGDVNGTISNSTFSYGKFINTELNCLKLNNVTFYNVMFIESSVEGLEYSTPKRLCELKNVTFEKCSFFDAIIEKTENSNLYFKKCRFIKSRISLTNSTLFLDKCDTTYDEAVGIVRIELFNVSDPEPLKIKDCGYLQVRLFSNSIDKLLVDGCHYIYLSLQASIKNLKINCEYCKIDGRNWGPKTENWERDNFDKGLRPNRTIEQLDIFCTKVGILNLFYYTIGTVQFHMSVINPKAGSALRNCYIDNLELSNLKVHEFFLENCFIKSALFKYWQIDDFTCAENNIDHLTLHNFGVAKKFKLEKNNIAQLTLIDAGVDPSVEWQSDACIIGLAEKLDSSTLNDLDGPKPAVPPLKDTTDQALTTYIDRTPQSSPAKDYMQSK